MWQQHHVPPWEVLGERWTARARKAWYLAAVQVTLDDQKTVAQRREADRSKAEAAATLKAGPRAIGAPTSRRLG